MSPESSTESYPAFARIGLRENPGENLNQITCPDRDSNPGHLVSLSDALTVTPQVWVNDLTIFCTGENLTTTQDIIQSSVKRIENWAKETGFKFSTNKSECILFSKRNTPHIQPELYLNNNKLPIVNTIKFLGIIFDRKLTWAPHLAALKEDCMRRISFLKTLAARNWGADYKVLICSYRILIRSKLDYGCIVYNSAKPSSLQKLNVIQNSALRIALGTFRTSPIASLQIEADELPLDIRRKQLSISYALKIAASSRPSMNSYIFSEHHDKQIHSAPFSSRLKQYFNEMNMPIPSISQRNKNIAHPPWRIMLPEINLDLTYHIKTETNGISYQQFCREQWDQYRNYRHIYTDGSQTNQGCGCAVVYPDHTMLYTLPSLYSILTCELYAIKKALEYILETETDKSYLLHTDSQSSLQALQDIFSTNALIQEIHQLLTDLMKQGRKITLILIPSHQGIPGNETVDAAAKEVTRLPLHFLTSIPHTDAIKCITRKLHNHWQTSWTESSSSKLHEIVQHSRMKYPLQNFKRQDQRKVAVVRLCSPISNMESFVDIFAVHSFSSEVNSSPSRQDQARRLANNSPASNNRGQTERKRPTKRYYVKTWPNIEMNNSRYDGSKTTVFIIHGFMSTGNDSWVEDMKNAYLNNWYMLSFCLCTTGNHLTPFSTSRAINLTRRFNGRWIGRGGPVARPPRSPDFGFGSPVPFDFWL
ncbi:hypothetical protein ANN_19480 [Periplaneta americana]|uniref:RNase H type-1 domain-containing protein n=1 Tax=Periplaneta americana TaxID=6978 RepID=A0ABQ8SA09_PERAM|nr:hypothetical protein ANN_19480 [Periplaneta americana]